MADNRWILMASFVLLAFIVLMSYVPAFKQGFNNLFATTSEQGIPSSGDIVTTPPPAKTFCEHDGITVTVGPTKKILAPTTSMTGEYHRLYIDGSEEGLKADGSTIALTPYDTISLIYGENSSTYYANKIDTKLPCKATLSTAQVGTDVNGKNIKDSYKLYAMETSGGLSGKCYNDDNGLLNEFAGAGTGGNESLGANEKTNIRCSIQGTAKEAFSPYGKIIVTTIFNSTAYDKEGMSTKTTSAGWSFAEDNAPTFRTNTNVTTGFTSKAYAWSKSGKATGGVELSGMLENELIEYTLAIDTDDTIGPTYHGGDIFMYFDDEDWYRHSEDGKMYFGPETDLDADVGQTKTLVIRFGVS